MGAHLVLEAMPVEGLAEEGHEPGGTPQACGAGLENGRLVLRSLEEALPDLEAAVLAEGAEPDEEDVGARPAGEPGGLRVQVHRPAQVEAGQSPIPRQELEVRRVRVVDLVQPEVTVPVLGTEAGAAREE